METIVYLLACATVFLGVSVGLQLARAWKNVRARYWRRRGQKARRRIEATEAERRAAAVAARERENFWAYNGTEQPEIEPEALE